MADKPKKKGFLARLMDIPTDSVKAKKINPNEFGVQTDRDGSIKRPKKKTK